MSRASIVLADDHTLILEGLEHLLKDEFEIVGMVRDGRSLVRLVEDRQPKLVILDIGMPLLNGIDAARQLRRAVPDTKIIFLTMYAEPDYVAEAFRSGASAYLLKTDADEELVQAIRTVLRHGTYVSRGLPEEVRQLPLQRLQLRTREDGVLSEREREVLQLLAEGRSAKEIGAILYVSVKTVEYHKYRMMKKLGVRTTAELMAYAVRNKLIGFASH